MSLEHVLRGDARQGNVSYFFVDSLPAYRARSFRVQYANWFGNWLGTAADYGQRKTAAGTAYVTGAVAGAAQAAVIDPARAAGGLVAKKTGDLVDWSRNDVEWGKRQQNMAFKCKNLWIAANKPTWSQHYWSGYSFYDKEYKARTSGRGPCGNWIETAAPAGAASMAERVCGTLANLDSTPLVIHGDTEMPADQKARLTYEMRQFYNTLFDCAE